MIYSIFIQQLIYGIITLFITYAVGKTILSFFNIKGNLFFQIFVTYIIGITTIVLFYSIYNSQGRTINLLFLPIIVFLLYHFRHLIIKPKFKTQDIGTEILWSILPLIFVFLVQSWFYFDFHKGIIKPLFSDYFIYAGISNNLQFSGTENNLLNCNYFFPTYNHIIKPYHYFELWFTAFFSSLFKNSLVNTYYFCTFTTFTSIFIIGIISLFENTIKNKYAILTIAIFLCFITDVTVPFNFNTSNSLSIMAINGQKVACIFCILLLAFITIRKGNWLIGLFILLSSPILSVTFLPGVWGGILLFCGIQILWNPKNNYKTYGLIMLSIFVIASLFIAFITNSEIKPSNPEYTRILNSGIFTNFDGSITFLNAKRIVANFISYTIPNIALHSTTRLLLYLPLILLLLKSSFKNRKLFLLILLILIAGALTTSISKPILNSDQFTSLLGICFIVFIIIAFADCMNSFIPVWKKLIISLGIMIITVISWISPFNSRANYDNDEDIQLIEKASTMISENSEIVIMTFLSDEDTKNSTFYSWIYVNTIMPISQFAKNPIIFSIANPELYLKTKMSYYDSIAYHNNTSINIWRQKGAQYTLETFIHHYKIKYFYIKKGAVIPDFIKAKTIRSIESPHSKSKFLVIKP